MQKNSFDSKDSGDGSDNDMFDNLKYARQGTDRKTAVKQMPKKDARSLSQESEEESIRFPTSPLQKQKTMNMAQSVA